MFRILIIAQCWLFMTCCFDRYAYPPTLFSAEVKHQGRCLRVDKVSYNRLLDDSFETLHRSRTMTRHGTDIAFSSTTLIDDTHAVVVTTGWQRRQKNGIDDNNVERLSDYGRARRQRLVVVFYSRYRGSENNRIDATGRWCVETSGELLTTLLRTS